MNSKWNRGVRQYEHELRSQFNENYPHGTKMTEDKLLNGANDWKQYSYGGNSLIYNEDIAQRLATPSELKRARGASGYVGSQANKQESWLDVQSRALQQASNNLLRRK